MKAKGVALSKSQFPVHEIIQKPKEWAHSMINCKAVVFFLEIGSWSSETWVNELYIVLTLKVQGYSIKHYCFFFKETENWWLLYYGSPWPGALGATQKSVGYLSGLNHKEKSIPFFLRSSVAGPIRSKSCSSVKGCINNTKKLLHANNIPS